MLIPQEHIQDFHGLKIKQTKDIFQLIQQITAALQKNKRLKGYNLINNTGKVAGQSVKHAHIHYFGRYSDESYSPFDILNNPQKHKRKKLTSQELSVKVDYFKHILK